MRHRISERGKLLLDKIHRLQCYAWNLCEIYDFTCCSENPKKHLPYKCEFSDNGIVSLYPKGVYNYYDVQQIEEFVAFKGAYEIASLIEKYDATLYKSEIFTILEYCYDNYASNAYVKPYIEDSSAVQEETNILQESMEEEIEETVSSLDEKDDEESEEQKEGRLATRARLVMRVTLQLIHCLIFLCAYRRMNAMIIAMIPLIRLKYPF